ncbi:beta-lactamase-like protein [Mycena capillaripes]|nr:beta-lactamase-like protein [Mycena capillaripes]
MSFQELGIPPSEATVSVKAFDIVISPSAVSMSAGMVMRPVPPGHEALSCPVFVFLVEHALTGRRVMFDLGLRKDLENMAPTFAEAFKTGKFTVPIERDILEQLLDDGVDLNSISAVIWSHAHFDHTGDMSKFPASTELVFGGSMLTETHAENPKSTLLETDLAGRKLVPINFDESSLEIGGFKAHDYFGDGSFYILNVPGHLAGHVSALARVTPSSFVFLGGDACHHAGMFRPTTALHRAVPCPGELLAATRLSVSTFDLTARTVPMLDVVEDGYEEPPVARASIAKMGAFDANADVFVVLAHNGSLVDVVGPFPALLDAWQAKGWKRLVTWAFLDDANPAFRFSDKGAETRV